MNLEIIPLFSLGPKIGYKEIKSKCNDLPSGKVDEVPFLDIKCRPSTKAGQVKMLAEYKKWPSANMIYLSLKWPSEK